jgi:hypothetical protein
VHINTNTSKSNQIFENMMHPLAILLLVLIITDRVFTLVISTSVDKKEGVTVFGTLKTKVYSNTTLRTLNLKLQSPCELLEKIMEHDNNLGHQLKFLCLEEYYLHRGIFDRLCSVTNDTSQELIEKRVIEQSQDSYFFNSRFLRVERAKTVCNQHSCNNTIEKLVNSPDLIPTKSELDIILLYEMSLPSVQIEMRKWEKEVDARISGLNFKYVDSVTIWKVKRVFTSIYEFHSKINATVEKYERGDNIAAAEDIISLFMLRTQRNTLRGQLEFDKCIRPYSQGKHTIFHINFKEIVTDTNSVVFYASDMGVIAKRGGDNSTRHCGMYTGPKFIVFNITAQCYKGLDYDPPESFFKYSCNESTRLDHLLSWDYSACNQHKLDTNLTKACPTETPLNRTCDCPPVVQAMLCERVEEKTCVPLKIIIVLIAFSLILYICYFCIERLRERVRVYEVSAERSEMELRWSV